MRILIAEDDGASRVMLAGVLKKMGHAVIETVNGEEAWSVMRAPGAPELAILDWMMPETDGLEVVQKIRAMKNNYQPYLIMLTAKSTKTDLIGGLDAGVNEYLVKPFDIAELRARVDVGRRMIELQYALMDKIEQLRIAMNDIKTLRGIIPICSNCKKIRDDKGYWNQVETYIHEHSDVEFTHGICPECVKKLYPGLE